MNNNYSIKDVVWGEAIHDGTSYIASATLYYGCTAVCDFYEHPVEGGYYPQPINAFADDAYWHFVADDIYDEIDAFHDKIKTLTIQQGICISNGRVCEEVSHYKPCTSCNKCIPF